MRRRKNGWTDRVAAETNGKVDPEVARLPETQRLAVILFAVEDFTYHDIADILDSPPGNVAAWLDTARRRLA